MFPPSFPHLPLFLLFLLFLSMDVFWSFVQCNRRVDGRWNRHRVRVARPHRADELTGKLETKFGSDGVTHVRYLETPWGFYVQPTERVAKCQFHQLFFDGVLATEPLDQVEIFIPKRLCEATDQSLRDNVGNNV